MVRFRYPSFLAFGALVAVLGAPRGALAQSADAQAESAIQSALEEDYLQTDFDKAEAKLRKAIKACGTDKCSPKVKARLHISLGTVLAGGQKQLDDARDEFVNALKLDENATPDPDFTKSEINFAYEEARKILKLGAPGPSSSAEGVEHTPPPEQLVNTPVPLSVELTGDLAKKGMVVVVTYRAPTAPAASQIKLRRIEEGVFRGKVPCVAVLDVGTLAYWIEVQDKGGEVLETMGSESAPLNTDIKEELDGAPPRWPGFSPPKSCGGDGTPAPDGRQCVDNSDCGYGETCSGTRCEGGDGSPDPEPEDGEIRRNWISVSFAPDVSVVSGDDVCSRAGQEDKHYVCGREDGSRYVGTPQSGQGNNVNLGFGLSTMRVMLAYDRLVLDNLALGLKVGFAFRGADVDGASFLPIHGEGRATYFLGSDPFKSTGARPFLFVAGGVAQVDTPVDVEVVEDGDTCGAASPGDLSSECTESSSDGRVEDRIQTLKAWKQAGQGFAGLGFGLSYAPADMVSLNLGVRVSVTLPVATVVFSPEAGLGFGF